MKTTNPSEIDKPTDATPDNSTSPPADETRPGFLGKVFRLFGTDDGAASGDGTVEAEARSDSENADSTKPDDHAKEVSSDAPSTNALPVDASPPEDESAVSDSNGDPSADSLTSECPVCGGSISGTLPCSDCGYKGSVTTASSDLLPPLELGTILLDNFEILELRRQVGGVNVYAATRKSDQFRVVIKESLSSEAGSRPSPAEPQESSADNDSHSTDAPAPGCTDQADGQTSSQPVPNSQPDSQPGTPSVAASPSSQSISVTELCCALERERIILENIKYPTIPAVVAIGRSADRDYLVLEDLRGQSLRVAWDDAETTDIQRIDWMIQLSQTLAKVHADGVIYNGIHPDSLYIDDGRRLVLTDFSSALRLKVDMLVSSATRFTAPELVLQGDETDLRADLFSFGATWYSLIVGRDLNDNDFEAEFVPQPNNGALQDVHPLLMRLLLKTFARNPEQRFPTEEELCQGTTPTAELQRNLLAYKNCLARQTLSVGAQTGIGIVRGANEDDYFIIKFGGKAGEESQEAGLLVLADGMGGAAAGEVASRIAVETIRDFLWPRLKELSDQPEHVPDLLVQSIQDAHTAVCSHGRAHPQSEGMACTVDVVFVLNNRVVVGHVGDSRVGIVNGSGMRWITEDQTLVSKLLKQKIISEAEAAVHPDASKLLQAVGGGKRVEPEVYEATLQLGDHLLCCSDGLTGHVEDERISELMLESESSQIACDRLVIEANCCGGTDNVTVIVASVR